MITLSGMLQVSARGAWLHCGIGRFVLEDSRLQGIPAGKHEGFFEIQRIEPTVSQKSPGQVQLSLLAVLKGFSLQKASNPLQDRQLSLWAEPDGATEPVAKTMASVIEKKDEETAPYSEEKSVDYFSEHAPINIIASVDEAPDTQESDTESLPELVELDWTLPRDQLKQQIQQLQAQGYQFQKDRQAFSRAA